MIHKHFVRKICFLSIKVLSIITLILFFEGGDSLVLGENRQYNRLLLIVAKILQWRGESHVTNYVL